MRVVGAPIHVVILAGPALLAGAVAGAASAAVWSSFAVSVPALVVVAGLVASWLWWRAPRSVLKAMDARPISPDSHRRFENIVESVCTTHGIPMPGLYVADADAVNAASLGLGFKSVLGLGSRSAHLVLTRGALTDLNRLELEAVVARELCEIRRGRDMATALACVARFPGLKRLVVLLAARLCDDQSVAEADIEAVGLTGYPPALASAIRHAAASPWLGTSPTVTHLCMVAPDSSKTVAGVDSRRMSASLRVDILGEL